MTKKNNNNTMIIIDAQAVLHRAWHALPKTLTDKNHKPINAVYGFTMLLLKLLKQYSPQKTAVAFDSKGPTFRHKKYKDYKANRPLQPQEFYDQIDKAKKILKGFNIPVFAKKGYEADDIIASIIKHQKKRNPSKDFLIVTGDLDLSQLIDEKTKLYFLKQGVATLKVYDKKDIKKRFGIGPEKVADFKALCGDSSDNIPGAPGIGPKTASNLLQKYDNLENIFNSLDQCNKRIKKIISDNKEQIKRAKELVELKYEIKGIDFEKLNNQQKFDINQIIKMLKKFNFQSLIKRIYKIENKQGNLA